MQIFSEIYNCYYQVVRSLLTKPHPLTKQNIINQVRELGYEESILYLVPNLLDGQWQLFQQEDNLFLTKLSPNFSIPLTRLQKSWLKSLILDEKICLFLDEDTLSMLKTYLTDITPLFQPDDFYFYDRFEDKDPFADEVYQKNFRILMKAIKNKQHVSIKYRSKSGQEIYHWYIPCRLEYSVKNDKFRLLALLKGSHRSPHMETMNLDRILEVSLLDAYSKKRPDINAHIKHSYYKEPVTILIHNERNALERTMLQFANYDKNTTKIDDNTYQCQIFYNKSVETELLIEILSFGPMIQVIGNQEFLKQLKKRLRRQMELLFCCP